VTTPSIARAPFWSDDFDLDLLRVLPEIETAIGRTGEIVLHTHDTLAHPLTRRITHPVCWNTPRGPAAFFGFADAATPSAYVTDAPLVDCTFLEAVRDCWVHGYLMVVERRAVLDGLRLRFSFDVLLTYHRRWREVTAAEVRGAQHDVMNHIAAACARVEQRRGALN
jgi:hypothetical protein